MSDPVHDLKRQLLAAAERQHAEASVRVAPRRWWPQVAQHRLLLATAALAIAAAVAVVVAAPWSTSAGFLEKAEAALTPPRGSILHAKWQLTRTSMNPKCTVTHPPTEIWIDQTRQYRFRILFSDLPPPNAHDRRALACSSNKSTMEIGGTFDGGNSLRFVPPNKLRALPGHFLFYPRDPAAALRKAINAGTAHDEGKTHLDGRTVERIRVVGDPNCGFPGCPRYWYVDPKTFYPVATRGGHGLIKSGNIVVPIRMAVRFLAYEYLPRNPPNLALTNIRAQHPNATGP
jgi:hypothetical protein